MSLWTHSAIAVRALRRNAMRTALTALGMIIGVAAVIVMVAIGTGARAVDRDADQAAPAPTSSPSSPGPAMSGPCAAAQGATTTLTVDDAEAIRQEVPGVRYLSPGLNTRAQVVAERANWNTQVQGDERGSAADPLLADAGRALLHRRRTSRARPRSRCSARCARSAVRARHRSDRRDDPHAEPAVPGGRRARAQGPVGDAGQDQDDTVIVPYTTVQKRLLGVQHVVEHHHLGRRRRVAGRR